MDVVADKREGDNKNGSNYAQSLFDPADRDAEDRERQAREIKAGLHPLKHKFVFWYTRRTPGVRTQTSYEDNIKQIMDFSTVEGFWVCYCHLARPSSLPSPTDLHLFKEGIRPLWEDSANCNGGKWIIRFKKAVSGRFWEDLVAFGSLNEAGRMEWSMGFHFHRDMEWEWKWSMHAFGSHGMEWDGAFMFVTSEDRWEWNKNTNQ